MLAFCVLFSDVSSHFYAITYQARSIYFVSAYRGLPSRCLRCIHKSFSLCRQTSDCLVNSTLPVSPSARVVDPTIWEDIYSTYSSLGLRYGTPGIQGSPSGCGYTLYVPANRSSIAHTYNATWAFSRTRATQIRKKTVPGVLYITRERSMMPPAKTKETKTLVK